MESAESALNTMTRPVPQAPGETFSVLIAGGGVAALEAVLAIAQETPGLGVELICPTPEFELRDRNGQPWRLADHRGKVVVLNFWSITCPPCLEELPSLEHLGHLAQLWGDVEVVAVSADEGWDAVSTVIPPDTRLTHVFDPTRSVITGQFGTRLFPETWIIDREGRVRFRYDGALDWGSPIVVELVEAYR